MRYIQLGEFDANRLAHEVQEVLAAWPAVGNGMGTLHMAAVAADHSHPNLYWELPEYASEQETMKTADLPESKAAYRWFDPDGPVEGLGPATIAGAGRRDWGSDGP
jgi:hypothetical protein